MLFLFVCVCRFRKWVMVLTEAAWNKPADSDSVWLWSTKPHSVKSSFSPSAVFKITVSFIDPEVLVLIGSDFHRLINFTSTYSIKLDYFWELLCFITLIILWWVSDNNCCHCFIDQAESEALARTIISGWCSELNRIINTNFDDYWGKEA